MLQKLFFPIFSLLIYFLIYFYLSLKIIAQNIKKKSIRKTDVGFEIMNTVYARWERHLLYNKKHGYEARNYTINDVIELQQRASNLWIVCLSYTKYGNVQSKILCKSLINPIKTIL